jgi:hypothetical protein
MRHRPTPSFILTLPLQVNPQQAARLLAHFECGRQLFNALLAAAQKLASRAYQSANRVCVGEARRVRFRSKGRGLDSLEGKTNTSSLPGASWAFTGKAWRRACRPPWKRPENMRVRRVSCAASVFLELERVGP